MTIARETIPFKPCSSGPDLSEEECYSELNQAQPWSSWLAPCRRRCPFAWRVGGGSWRGPALELDLRMLDINIKT